MSETTELLDELDERLSAAVVRACAEHGEPTLGTVELTISELAELLLVAERAQTVSAE